MTKLEREIFHGLAILLKEWEDNCFSAGDDLVSHRIILFGSFMQLAREARVLLEEADASAEADHIIETYPGY